jgi:hypothetical protein
MRIAKYFASFVVVTIILNTVAVAAACQHQKCRETCCGGSVWIANGDDMKAIFQP